MAENKSITMRVEYGTDLGSTDCSGALFEIPNTEVVGGDAVYIRLWGMSFDMLAPYALVLGTDTDSMGAGVNTEIPLDDIIEMVNFGDSITSTTKWVIDSISAIIAVGDILDIEDGIWAYGGADLLSQFTSSDNILSTVSAEAINGNIQVTYRSTQDVQELVDFTETESYQCEWPIHSIGRITAVNELIHIDEATGAVLSYAAQGEDVTDRFQRKGYSCIKVIDGTKLFGTVKLEYTRSPYYKLWQWTVPTGAEGQYWFFIYKDGFPINKFAIELPDLTTGLPEPRNVTIRVYARDGGASLDSAYVYLDGLFVGVTDEEGLLQVNGIMTGTHDIKVTRTGFIDSDLDELYNDKIEIY